MPEPESIPSKKCIFRLSLDKEKQKSAIVPPGFQDAGCHLCGGYLFSCKYYTPFSKMVELGFPAADLDAGGPVLPGRLNHNGNGQKPVQ